MKPVQVILVALVANLASAGNQGGGLPTSYGVPNTGYGATAGGGYDNVGGHGNSVGFGNGGHGNGGHGYGGVNNYDEQPKSYQFGYAVRDHASGNDYGRQEVSDGNVVQGEYRVQLPDGRLQIVRYTADWQNGFRADVRYEGEAQYPAGGPGSPDAGRPVYGPPAYHQ